MKKSLWRCLEKVTWRCNTKAMKYLSKLCMRILCRTCRFEVWVPLIPTKRSWTPSTCFLPMLCFSPPTPHSPSLSSISNLEIKTTHLNSSLQPYRLHFLTTKHLPHPCFPLLDFVSLRCLNGSLRHRSIKKPNGQRCKVLIQQNHLLQVPVCLYTKL